MRAVYLPDKQVKKELDDNDEQNDARDRTERLLQETAVFNRPVLPGKMTALAETRVPDGNVSVEVWIYGRVKRRLHALKLLATACSASFRSHRRSPDAPQLRTPVDAEDRPYWYQLA